MGFLLDSEPDSAPPVAEVADFLLPDLEEGLGAPGGFPAAEDGLAFEGVLLDPRGMLGVEVDFLGSSFLAWLSVDSSFISFVALQEIGVMWMFYECLSRATWAMRATKDGEREVPGSRKVIIC